jgi:osmotically-inducible protein OsmY
MNNRAQLMGIVCAYSIALACALGGYAAQADAQTSEDWKLQKQVAAALHANPYLDDEHIDVSAEKGVVVLRGRVFDDWKLRKALSTARR